MSINPGPADHQPRQSGPAPTVNPGPPPHRKQDDQRPEEPGKPARPSRTPAR